MKYNKIKYLFQERVTPKCHSLCVPPRASTSMVMLGTYWNHVRLGGPQKYFALLKNFIYTKSITNNASLCV